MPTLENVSEKKYRQEFCLTDCGPSDGCNPDDDCLPDYDCSPDDSTDDNK